MSMILNPYRFAGAASTFGEASRQISSGNYLHFPSPVNYNDSYTICCWFKRNDSISNNQGILSLANTAADGTPAALIAAQTRDLCRFYFGGSYFHTGESVGTGWHHVGMTVAGQTTPTVSTAKAYFDGTNVGTQFSAASWTNDTNVYIGMGYNSVAPGWYADFRVYNAVLTDGEMANLASGTDVSSNLQRHYLGNTDSLTDLTGNGPTLTEVGTTTYSTDGPFD